MIYKLQNRPYIWILFYVFLITITSHVFINVGDVQHDYYYHMGRIVGLAQSIKNGDWLPNLNFVFAKGIGYSVPSFYGNWQLYLPAFLLLISGNASVAYTLFIFLIYLFASWSMYYVINYISDNRGRAIVAACFTPLLYTWFGYGMTMVIMLVPFLVLAMYRILYLDKKNPFLLGIIIALLVQTHVLSTVVLAIFSLIFTIVSYKQLNIKKIYSFITSIVIAIFLSAGYIFQYIEQIRSQTFFVTWTLRDFPFPTEAIAIASSFFENIINYANPLIIIGIIYLIVTFQKLSPFNRNLLITILTLFVLQSSILPWEGLLRYTYLATLQDVRRLVFFVPTLFVIIMSLSLEKKYLKIVYLGQLLLFVGTFLNFYPNSSRIQQIRNTNQMALNSLQNIQSGEFDTSGDEYFNLSINHDNVRNGKMTEFVYNPDDIKLVNIKKSYNSLEFDVIKQNKDEKSEIVLPLVWYKGYQATYSQFAKGTQPTIKYRNLSNEEKDQYVAVRKPKVTEFAENDGRAVITISAGGHVKVLYEKTLVQKIGYVIESLAWLLLIPILYKHRKSYFKK